MTEEKEAKTTTSLVPSSNPLSLEVPAVEGERVIDSFSSGEYLVLADRVPSKMTPKGQTSRRTRLTFVHATSGASMVMIMPFTQVKLAYSAAGFIALACGARYRIIVLGPKFEFPLVALAQPWLGMILDICWADTTPRSLITVSDGVIVKTTIDIKDPCLIVPRISYVKLGPGESCLRVICHPAQEGVFGVIRSGENGPTRTRLFPWSAFQEPTFPMFERGETAAKLVREPSRKYSKRKLINGDPTKPLLIESESEKDEAGDCQRSNPVSEPTSEQESDPEPGARKAAKPSDDPIPGPWSQ